MRAKSVAYALGAAVLILAAAELIPLPLPFATPSVVNPPRVVEKPAGASLKAPNGFHVDLWADGFDRPRFMLLGRNGEIFLADSGTPGTVYVFEKGESGRRKKLITGLARPYGIAQWNEYLYVAEPDSVKRYRYDPAGMSAGRGEEVISLRGLAAGDHWTRSLLFDSAGRKLYVGVGSASDHTPGGDPRRAAIDRYNPDGTGHEIFASGLRNPIGIHWYPGTDALWVAVQERDMLGDNLVPDYFTPVRQGGFYGWPYSYIGRHEDPRVKPQRPDLVKTAIVPDVLFDAHVAVLDYTFYTGRQFPAEYRGGAFLAFHGSWNRSKRDGYEVAFVPFRNGRPSGPARDFVTGWMLSPDQKDVWGRPVAVLQISDGSLLVSDDGGRKIWRVSIPGRPAKAPPRPMMGDSAYWISRLVFERGLALVYLIAFLNAACEFLPLAGERGLLPVPLFVRRVAFWQAPSLFFAIPRDWAFRAAAWAGVALAALALSGVAQSHGMLLFVLVWLALWVLYLSFVNVGQRWYGFGWESILLEAGFFTIFAGPDTSAPPVIVLYIWRWILFRVMFGAGLIKLRGDSCWRDLTCLNYHFETQPIPNPLSWHFHWLAPWTRRAGVMFNHVAEIGAPLAYFAPQPAAGVAGLVTIAFQVNIMLSGNLSWLNLLTIVLAVPTISDDWLRAAIPVAIPALHAPGFAYETVLGIVAALTAALSYWPVRNMLSPAQAMNANFNTVHLVNTYGAFGGITRRRYEIVIEGTADEAPVSSTHWIVYEFKGKPGDPFRRPRQIAPYHLRLDWLMWFAAMSSYDRHPWFVHLLAKLLEGDRAVLGLLRSNPFPGAPPRYVRALYYEYRFATPEERRRSGRWWTRELLGAYFPAVSLRMPAFREVLAAQGWTVPAVE